MSDDVTPEQSRNILNAFLEIRDRLKDADLDRTAIQKALDANHTLMMAVFWLVLASILLNIVWIIVKIVIDRRQERRFKTLTDIAAAHGALTDEQKDRTVRAGQKIETASARAVQIGVGAVRAAKEVAEKAATKADEATREMREAVGAIQAELHEFKEDMTQKIKWLIEHIPNGPAEKEV